MTVEKDNDPRLDACLVCLVVAEGCTTGSTPPALAAALEELAGRRKVDGFPPPAVKEAVRDMLRPGGYKPAGRQKPASEYLAQAAREERFPSINAPVDCNNLLSLETGLPISLLDAKAVGSTALVRICGQGESYVFNASGHEMDLSGLLCVCSPDGTPLGNPIKDSMAAKLKEDSADYAGLIYAPASLYDAKSLAAVGERFAALLLEHCGARTASVQTVA
ncbi:MAG: hypothetical protein E4H20_09175 [Spirochaetales bacterium]|nr:MAG: hypothetical protein E4H20_09175 [Spirochaetales bacterium]